MVPKLVTHTETRYSLMCWKTVWRENIWKLGGGKKDKVGEYSVMRNVTICICLPTSLQCEYQGGYDGWNRFRACERREIHRGF